MFRKNKNESKIIIIKVAEHEKSRGISPLNLKKGRSIARKKT